MTQTPCKQVTGPEDDLWYSDKPDQIAEAVRLCGTCPQQTMCAILGFDEVHGVWGGTVDPEQAPKGPWPSRDVRGSGSHYDRYVVFMRREQEAQLRAWMRKGMDAAEIAIRLGISHDAAYGRIRRMQKREAASV